MRVGIDATYVLSSYKSGVETYTLNLIRALLNLPSRPEIFLYAASHEQCVEAQSLFQKAERARVSCNPRLWLRLRMPLLMLLDQVTVAHFPGTLLPRLVHGPVVTTFYDLAALRYPELYDQRDLRHYDRLVPSAAARAAVVIAISESTKRDLVELMSVPEAKIHVTLLGVNAHFRPVANARQILRERYGLAGPYVLACVGSGHPRKNLSAVVYAFGELGLPELRLVIVGCIKRDRRAAEAIEKSPARGRIITLGHVPEDVLPAIYSAAEVFCFPSIYEGFGLPVLEAMACGTAVVCANSSSLPEVGGEAAVYVDPFDPEALTAALRELLCDETWRHELGVKGLERAKEFTWDRTATQTLEAYKAAEGSR